jgi:hypothetical protein
MSSDAQHSPICPKCGYDQSGEIATWESLCPIEGRCPECGLSFEWADVINPNRVELEWYIEHAKSKWDLLRRTVPTLWYLLIPNRYWSRMRMESPRSMKTYLLWILMMMFVLHFISSVAQIWSMYNYTNQSNETFRQLLVGRDTEVQAIIQSNIIDISSIDFWYPLIGGVLLDPLISRYWWGFEDGVVIGVMSLGISAMWFLLFCAFPISRKRAKLRVVHVFRAMLIAGLLPMILIEFMRFAGAGLFFVETNNFLINIDSVGDQISMWLFFLVLIWVQWFWISAVKVGWRVPSNWVSIVIVTIASLMGFVIAGLLAALIAVVQSGAEILATWFGI